MVDWVSGMADASVSERDSGSVLVRVPGSPDVLKEAAISAFVTKDAGGNVGIGDPSPNVRLSVRQLGEASLAIISVVDGANDSPKGSTLVFRSGSSEAPTALIQSFNRFADINACDLVFSCRNDSGSVSERMKINIAGHILPGGDNSQNIGAGSLRFGTIYAATGTINTSDERAKTNIGEIPDGWLDAWAGVEWRRFKMVDGKRWHVGLVAQQVHAAFAAHDLDAFQIGLCCFDAWDEVREPIFDGDVDTGKTRVTLEAGDRWGLRYDECQAIEAAYQRREISRMAARLVALENGGQEAGA